MRETQSLGEEREGEGERQSDKDGEKLKPTQCTEVNEMWKKVWLILKTDTEKELEAQKKLMEKKKLYNLFSYMYE